MRLVGDLQKLPCSSDHGHPNPGPHAIHVTRLIPGSVRLSAEVLPLLGIASPETGTFILGSQGHHDVLQVGMAWLQQEVPFLSQKPLQSEVGLLHPVCG